MKTKLMAFAFLGSGMSVATVRYSKFDTAGTEPYIAERQGTERFVVGLFETGNRYWSLLALAFKLSHFGLFSIAKQKT